MLYDFTARMHEDDIVYIHQRAQRAGIALKTKYSPLVDKDKYTTSPDILTPNLTLIEYKVTLTTCINQGPGDYYDVTTIV